MQPERPERDEASWPDPGGVRRRAHRRRRRRGGRAGARVLAAAGLALVLAAVGLLVARPGNERPKAGAVAARAAVDPSVFGTGAVGVSDGAGSDGAGSDGAADASRGSRARRDVAAGPGAAPAGGRSALAALPQAPATSLSGRGDQAIDAGSASVGSASASSMSAGSTAGTSAAGTGLTGLTGMAAVADPFQAPDAARALIDEVVALTNLRRAAVGCPALAVDSRLAASAQRHSEDMAAHNYFAHTSLDGMSPFDRIAAAGYVFSIAAENIAAGQKISADVIKGWMGSPGHRANILNCSLTRIGVGYAHGGDYGTYWVQDFGAP